MFLSPLIVSIATRYDNDSEGYVFYEVTDAVPKELRVIQVVILSIAILYFRVTILQISSLPKLL